jgi:hypothetical protein
MSKATENSVPVNEEIVSQATALVNYDEQLAIMAAGYATMEESSAPGEFFSLKGGQLAFAGDPIKGNSIGVIIFDSIIENVYYGSEYDPDKPQAPKCFAFGKDENDMDPHEVVIEAGQMQAVSCNVCPHNEWGSASKGKGKACRNARRLAMVAAGDFNKAGEFSPYDDIDEVINGTLGFMKLPVTSVKGYANYIKKLAITMKRPPFAVYTKITVVPDAKTQFKVKFDCLGLVSNDSIKAIIVKADEVSQIIDFPYSLDVPEGPLVEEHVPTKTY